MQYGKITPWCFIFKFTKENVIQFQLISILVRKCRLDSSRPKRENVRNWKKKFETELLKLVRDSIV